MRKLNLMVICLLTSSLYAESHLINATMKELDYTRPRNNQGEAGTISFNRLELKRPSMNMTLDNGSRVFDSKIDLSGRTVNLRGNNHRLRFSFDKAETINLLDQAALTNISFRLTDDLLTQSADRIYARTDDNDVELSNYKVECSQHPDYDMRDTKTIMYGCMQSATLSPKSGTSVNLAANYTHEKLGPISLNSKIKSAKIGASHLELKLGTTNFHVNSTLDVQVDESLSFSCQKSTDVTVIDKDRLISDCSGDFMAHLKKVVVTGGIELGESNEYTNMGLSVEGGFLGNGSSSLMVQAQKVVGSVGQKVIEANKVSLRCNKSAGFTDISADNLKKACTSSMELRTIDSSGNSFFKMSDVTEDGGRAEVKGSLKSVEIKNSKITVSSGRTIIDHPKMEVRMTGITGYAAKKSGALDLKDFDAVAKKALTNFKLERNDVVIKDKEKSNAWTYLVIDKVEGGNGRIKLNMPAIQTVSGDNIKSYYWLNVNCEREESDDLSTWGILRGCSRNGTIEMTHLIQTKGIAARAVRSWYDRLLTLGDTSDVIPSNLTLDDSQKVRNIAVYLFAGTISINLEAKIAGIWKTIQVNGKLTINEEFGRLEIRRTSGNIPTSVLNFGLDQALGSDIILTDGDMWYIKFGG